MTLSFRLRSAGKTGHAVIHDAARQKQPKDSDLALMACHFHPAARLSISSPLHIKG